MATTLHASHLCLVALDGAQIAPAPPPNSRDEELKEDRAITLAIMHEHLGHLINEIAEVTHSVGCMAQSVDRLKTLLRETEASLGIAIREFMPRPLPGRPGGRTDRSA